MNTKYRISGKCRMSKDVQNIFFIPTLFDSRSAAVEKAKAYTDNNAKQNGKDVYKTSIEGRSASVLNSHDAADTFSVVSYDEEVLLCLNVYPVIEYDIGCTYLYAYRGYKVYEIDDNTWGISASDFLFGTITKGNIEAALQHIDHIIFEHILQQRYKEEE